MKPRINDKQRIDKGKAEIELLKNAIKSSIAIKDYAKARKSIRKLERYSTIEALDHLINIELIRSNFRAAIKEFRKASPKIKGHPIFKSYIKAKISVTQGKYVEALQILQDTDTSNPESEKNILARFYDYLAQCYSFLGYGEKGPKNYLKAYEYADSISEKINNYTNYLFTVHYLPLSIQEQREAAEKYQTIFGIPRKFHHPKPDGNKKKLRIGYISPDVRKHVVLRFSYVLFVHYDRERFEVFVYANNQEDFYSRQVASSVDNWRNVLGCTAEEMAGIVHEDKIDILVDLAGHTANSCLPVLTFRPAPIQISGIGYWASTGLKDVDYFLGDKYLDTEEAKQGFTEELIVLPNSHFCCAGVEGTPKVGELPYKRNGYITFGCFNSFGKINDEVLQTWARIMQQIPDSRLILKNKIFIREYNARFAFSRIEEAGIPLDRIKTSGFDSNYINEFNNVDISLDTFPYPGGGTTCDSLYMSVPVISLKGKSHGERFGYSILQNAGLGELCADSIDEYVEKAVNLARDVERLEELHNTIKQRFMDSPVMDADLYMENIQNAYEEIWKKYVEQYE